MSLIISRRNVKKNPDLSKKEDTNLTRSARDMFAGNPTKSAWKFEGVPTLCDRISLILVLCVLR